MKTSLWSKFWLASLFLCISLTTFSQKTKKTESDSLLTAHAVVKAKEIYTSALGSDSHLFNGSQYVPVLIHNYDIGYPYFLSDDWIDSTTIVYSGQRYDNITAQYDIVHEKLIIDHTYSHFAIQLVTENISEFIIGGHTFVHLKSDSGQHNTPPTGFYDLLYDGRVKLYARRRKEINSVIEAPLVKTEFLDKTQFFVYKDGDYTAVRNKSSVLKLFSDRKSALRKYLNKNKFNFKTNRDAALMAATRFYDVSEK